MCPPKKHFRNRRSFTLRLVTFFLLVPIASSKAGILRVPQDFATPQAAVAASTSGDTILLSPGLYIVPGQPCSLVGHSPTLCGLVLKNGTSLVGSGPAQTVLDFAGAPIGILVQQGVGEVKAVHLQNVAGAVVWSYIGSSITVKNAIFTADTPSSFPIGGMELNQGNAYTVYNTIVDHMRDATTWSAGIDVPFGGSRDIQNNLVTSNDRGMLAGGFSGTYAFNDVFGSTIGDWQTCSSVGCVSVSPPPSNISTDPLYCPDFTLQPGSPGIDAGNPAILDPDGTRSDMGAYGGPDAILPPLIAAPCVVDLGEVFVGSTGTPRVIELRSTISESQTVTGITSDSTAFAVSAPSLPIEVPPVGTIAFSVIFSPPSSGDFQGEISASTSNPFPTRVRVTGTGVVPPVLSVSIDIKPGSFPNSINLGSGGSVPVAILSSANFDATTVDPLSVTLAGAQVNLKGKGTPQASAEDANGDGLLDLVVHVTTEALQLSETDTEAVLTGQTYGSEQIQGSDSVRIVPPE